MDLNLVRTFIAIVDAGSFVAASHRLHVTQSTVSVRVRALESVLGKSVFVRNNSSCELTASGRQFYPYACSLLRVWEEAQHQVAVPDRFTDRLSVAGQYSVWDGFLFDWLRRCRAALPATAFRLSAGLPHRLMAELLDGIHDLIVIHAPELRPSIRVEEIFEDRLILVCPDPTIDFRARYAFVDWGENFREMHAAAFPDLHSPGFSVEMGPLSVQILLRERVAGYVPERLARSYLEQKALYRVSDAPTFLYPAFAAYPKDIERRPALRTAVAMLHENAKQMDELNV